MWDQAPQHHPDILEQGFCPFKSPGTFEGAMTHHSPVESESLGSGSQTAECGKTPQIPTCSQVRTLLKLQHVRESSGDLIKMQVLMQWVAVEPEILHF